MTSSIEWNSRMEQSNKWVKQMLDAANQISKVFVNSQSTGLAQHFICWNEGEKPEEKCLKKSPE